MNRRRRVQQRLHDPPRLLDTVLAREARAVADHRRLEQYLVRGRAFPTLLRELHLELDRRGTGDVRAVCVDDQLDSGRRVEPDHKLIGVGRGVAEAEAQLRGMLEDDSELGLSRLETLAGADEEWHARPPPVRDLEA